MKKILLLPAFFFVCFSFLQAQGFKNILKNAGAKDSTSKTGIDKLFDKVSNTKSGPLTNDEVINGLKEALAKGTENGTQKLSMADGFFKDAVIKILMPEEAKKVETKLRNLGLGKQVDNAILSMNRAAEDAAKSASPIFLNAIKGMNFQDALSILKGGDHAATNYLEDKTTAALVASFRPVIDASLEKVNATKYWNTVFTTYNRFSTDKVNTNLAEYVTEKALAGIFYQVAQEEQKIRKDPLARTSDLLKKVFSN
ncbi:MAG TPA: DUF4197 domain-containing protein [Chitinophagaceae bacterium]